MAIDAATPPDLVVLRSSRRRRVGNSVFWALSFVALGLVIAPTAWMVGGVVVQAVPTWSFRVLTTTSSGESGGLLNAIAGTLVLIVGVLAVAGTISVLAGIHLSEYASGWRRGLLRGAYEVLAGIPSIVLGYVGYVALVVHFHWGFSVLAGIIVLSIMVMPYIAKATESALAQVPTTYREGADALGIPESWAMRRIVLRAALPGIVTGLLMATAIAVGETAPLLYTAGWSDTMPTGQLTHAPIGYLTYPVWTFYNQPSASAHALAHDAALLLLVLVLLLIGLARLIVWRTQRHAE